MKRRNIQRYLFFFTIHVGLLLILSGCWSSRPIEDLNFIVGSALDKEKNEKIRSTIQYALPESIGKEKNSGTAKPYINVTEISDSIEQGGWETTLKREGYIFGEHRKVIIISDSCVREMDLNQLMDLFYRHATTRESTSVFIARGSASKLFDLKEPGVVPSLRIAEIANQQLTTRIIKPSTITNILEKTTAGSSFLLQQITLDNGDVKFDGAAIIKGKTHTMVGSFNKKELEGINWLTGEIKRGSLKFNDNKLQNPIAYEVESIRSTIQPKVEHGNISFNVNIESEGKITEYWNPFKKNTFNNENIKKIEKKAEKEVQHLVRSTINKMQKEYQVDVTGFGNQLRIKYPKVWEKVKEDWDQKFSEVTIKYAVKITIKDYGMFGSKQSN
ncbi:Ger(x)C family spore germination protein [Bacillus cereus]|uniref:Ger(x)C family spore germination protein n=1 Tax=Bacillus cereus TaxID=1396 RepID=UPI002AC1224B|nr:Ger(x)C family spore germination protein [Bacillus cereus]MDZ4533974.1 Ger(x)C family spore germination protein [Bacillus cereus]